MALNNKTPKERFSAVVLPDNPAGVSPQKNLTGLPRVARDIAADVYNNIQSWNAGHIEGANLTKRIAQLKADSCSMYPNGLERLTNELFDVIKKLKGTVGALEFLATQMHSLVKLHKKSTPLFVSLSNEQLAELVKSIADCYQAELKMKEYVLENVAHTRTKSEIMFYAVCWTHQQNITTDVSLKLEMLLTEMGHRKIS